MKRDTGLHGASEILVGLLLLCFWLIPGLIFYVLASKQDWCAACRQRPNGPAAPTWVVLSIVILAALIFMALVAGG